LLELTAREGTFTPTYGVEVPFMSKRARGLGGVEVGLGGGEAAQPAQRLGLELAYPLP
jgi:hypothetical protein